MKKNLFSKLLLTHIFMVILSIGIISVLFYAFFSNYYFNSREQQLISHGTELAKIISPYLKNKHYAKSDEIVGVLNQTSASRFWVVDSHAKIISGSEGLSEHDELCPDNEQLQSALKGEMAVNRGDTPINNESIKETNVPVLSVALPVYIDNKIVGAVFVCNPISEISRSITKTFEMLMMAGMIVIAILTLISNFISKSITRPLEEMTKVSLEIAKGNFSQRISVSSSDEVGKLAETFNYMVVKVCDTMGELKNEKSKIEEMERLQREFVANASHELRTPLTTIRGYLEAIMEGVVKGQDKEKYISIILKETLRLHRLVNSLLDLSRIESGKINIIKRKLNITNIIEKTTIQLKPLIENHQIDLELILPENPEFVYGDEDLIAQVIINYITNAIRYTPDGGKITVKAVRSENEVQVNIADTGIGISPDNLPKVWKRFYKVNEARALSKEGAGLGLSLVKEIVEHMGGRVWAESTPGQGSTFGFSLSINV